MKRATLSLLALGLLASSAQAASPVTTRKRSGVERRVVVKPGSGVERLQTFSPRVSYDPMALMRLNPFFLAGEMTLRMWTQAIQAPLLFSPLGYGARFSPLGY